MLLRCEWIHFKGNVRPGHVSSMSHGTMTQGGWNDEGAFRHLAQDLDMREPYPDLDGNIPLDPRLVSASESSSPSTFVQALTPPSEDVEMLTSPDTASVTDDAASDYEPIISTTGSAGPTGPTGLLQEHANNGLKESD